MHRVALLEETPFSHNGMAVVAKLPKMSKVVDATVENVCEVVEVVVPIHSGESRPNAVLHNLSRLLSNFLQFQKISLIPQFTGFLIKDYLCSCRIPWPCKPKALGKASSQAKLSPFQRTSLVVVFMMLLST